MFRIFSACLSRFLCFNLPIMSCNIGHDVNRSQRADKQRHWCQRFQLKSHTLFLSIFVTFPLSFTLLLPFACLPRNLDISTSNQSGCSNLTSYSLHTTKRRRRSRKARNEKKQKINSHLRDPSVPLLVAHFPKDRTSAANSRSVPWCWT